MHIYSLDSCNMRGRKFRLSARKNEERKRAAKAKSVKPIVEAPLIRPDMTVSLPLTAFTAGVLNSVQSLRSRLHTLKLPTSWVDVAPQHSPHPLTLCKVRNQSSLPQVDVSFTLRVTADFEWSLALHGHSLDVHSCEVLKATSKALDSTSKVYLPSSVDSGFCQAVQRKCRRKVQRSSGASEQNST